MTITEKRRSLHISLGECAKAIGVSRTELAAIERGDLEPMVAACRGLARLFGWELQKVLWRLPQDDEARLLARYDTDNSLAELAARQDATIKGTERGSSAYIVCPICINQLTYSVLEDGSITGACVNPDCVRWM